MDLRVIIDNEFDQLMNLVFKMYKDINADITPFGAANTLMHDILTREGFLAIGLFNDDNTLVGFSTGYSETNKFEKKLFYFSGIYVIMRNNRNLKKLIDFSFAKIKELGYTNWLVDATNPNILSILKKYSGEELYTRLEGKL